MARPRRPDDIMIHVADMLGRAGSLIWAEVANV